MPEVKIRIEDVRKPSQGAGCGCLVVIFIIACFFFPPLDSLTGPHLYKWVKFRF